MAYIKSYFLTHILQVGLSGSDSGCRSVTDQFHMSLILDQQLPEASSSHRGWKKHKKLMETSHDS